MLFSLSSVSSCLPTLESDNFSFSSLLSLSLLSVLIYDTKAMCVCALVIIAQSLLASFFRRKAGYPNTAPFLPNSFPLVAPAGEEPSWPASRPWCHCGLCVMVSRCLRGKCARLSVVAHSVLEFLLSCRKYYLREGQCTFVPFSFRLNSTAVLCCGTLCY